MHGEIYRQRGISKLRRSCAVFETRNSELNMDGSSIAALALIYNGI